MSDVVDDTTDGDVLTLWIIGRLLRLEFNVSSGECVSNQMILQGIADLIDARDAAQNEMVRLVGLAHEKAIELEGYKALKSASVNCNGSNCCQLLNRQER